MDSIRGLAIKLVVARGGMVVMVLTLLMASASFRRLWTLRRDGRCTRTSTVIVAPAHSFRATNSIRLCEYCRPDRVDSE